MAGCMAKQQTLVLPLDLDILLLKYLIQYGVEKCLNKVSTRSNFPMPLCTNNNTFHTRINQMNTFFKN